VHQCSQFSCAECVVYRVWTECRCITSSSSSAAKDDGTNLQPAPRILWGEALYNNDQKNKLKLKHKKLSQQNKKETTFHNASPRSQHWSAVARGYTHKKLHTSPPIGGPKSYPYILTPSEPYTLYPSL
jgi:hypothetical protein